VTNRCWLPPGRHTSTLRPAKSKRSIGSRTPRTEYDFTRCIAGESRLGLLEPFRADGLNTSHLAGLLPISTGDGLALGLFDAAASERHIVCPCYRTSVVVSV